MRSPLVDRSELFYEYSDSERKLDLQHGIRFRPIFRSELRLCAAQNHSWFWPLHRADEPSGSAHDRGGIGRTWFPLQNGVLAPFVGQPLRRREKPGEGASSGFSYGILMSCLFGE